MNPVQLQNIRIITVSGRIAAGSTTLAKNIAKKLGWKHIEGGEIFWEAVRKRLNLGSDQTGLRPDEEDQLFDEQLKKILKEDSNIVLETKLAGFNAQNIPDIFKILVICEDEDGVDQTAIRIDRLLNREDVSIEDAKKEIIHREKSDLEKWRKMYADNDSDWVYWHEKYYDLTINTYFHNHDEALQIALETIGYSKNNQ